MGDLKAIREYSQCLETAKRICFWAPIFICRRTITSRARFEADSYYMVTTISRPDLCEQLNEAMNAIYSADPNFADKLYEKYFTADYAND